jgi:hypothetical protein
MTIKNKKGTHKRYISSITGKPMKNRTTGSIHFVHNISKGKSSIKSSSIKFKPKPHTSRRVTTLRTNSNNNRFRPSKEYSKKRYVGRKIRRG